MKSKWLVSFISVNLHQGGWAGGGGGVLNAVM